MKTLYSVEAISKGGRLGTIQASDRPWFVPLGDPTVVGAELRGPTPELLFAGAYSACFHSALSKTAKHFGTLSGDSTVRAIVSLVEDDQGVCSLAVELHAHLPGVDHAQVRRVMDEAHKICPYSKALRGESAVTLFAD